MRFYVVTDLDLESLETTAFERDVDLGDLIEQCRAMEVYRDANGFFIKKEIRK